MLHSFLHDVIEAFDARSWVRPSGRAVKRGKMFITASRACGNRCRRSVTSLSNSCNNSRVSHPWGGSLGSMSFVPTTIVSPCYTCGICPGVGCGICHWGGSIPLWLWVRLGQSLWYLGYQWMRQSNLLLLHERGSNFLGRRVVPLPMIEVIGHFFRLLLAWFACSFIINYHGYVTAGW